MEIALTMADEENPLPNLSLEPGQTSDTRMIMKAIEKGWKIPDHAFAELPAMLIKLIFSKDSAVKPRQKMSAIRALLAMNAQNQNERNGEKEDSPNGTTVNVNIANIVPNPASPELLALVARIRAETEPGGQTETSGTDGVPSDGKAADADGPGNGSVAKLETGPPFSPPKPGTNGHHNGNGYH